MCEPNILILIRNDELYMKMDYQYRHKHILIGLVNKLKLCQKR